MAKLVKYVLIGSIERSSGKSAVTLGLVPQLRNLGFDIAYGKPLGTDFDDDCDHQVDADCDFIAQTLGLSEVYMRSPILMLDQVTIDKHLYHQDLNYYHQALTHYLQQIAGNLVLLEGPGTLQEGSLFNLSVPRMAEVLDAAVMLVVRCHSHSLLDEVLSAKERLGDRLIAIVLNDVTDQQVAKVETQIKPDRKSVV